MSNRLEAKPLSWWDKATVGSLIKPKHQSTDTPRACGVETPGFGPGSTTATVTEDGGIHTSTKNDNGCEQGYDVNASGCSFYTLQCPGEPKVQSQTNHGSVSPDAVARARRIITGQ